MKKGVLHLLKVCATAVVMLGPAGIFTRNCHLLVVNIFPLLWVFFCAIVLKFVSVDCCVPVGLLHKKRCE